MASQQINIYIELDLKPQLFGLKLMQYLSVEAVTVANIVEKKKLKECVF